MLMKGTARLDTETVQKEVSAFESLYNLRRLRELLWNKYGPFLRERKDISESGIKRPEGKAKRPIR